MKKRIVEILQSEIESIKFGDTIYFNAIWADKVDEIANRILSYIVHEPGLNDTLITEESALNSGKWEKVVTGYEDRDYVVFREKGMKENQSIWLHIHEAGGTGVFINEHNFIRSLTTWEHLEKLIISMFGEY
jgi:hypothetical protein